MNNKKTIYRTTLMSRLTWIVILICCVAFIGCPVAEEMADDVLQPMQPTTKGIRQRIQTWTRIPKPTPKGI